MLTPERDGPRQEEPSRPVLIAPTGPVLYVLLRLVVTRLDQSEQWDGRVASGGRDQSGHSASRPGVCVYAHLNAGQKTRNAPPTLASFLAFIGDCTHAAPADRIHRPNVAYNYILHDVVLTSVSWSDN